MAKIVKNLNEFLDAVASCMDNETDKFFYRGQSASGEYDKESGITTPWKLEPSLTRNIGYIKNEHKIFRDIISRCPSDFEDTMNTFNKLVKMQHYELPTRLLDITSNPLVALYFACIHECNEKRLRNAKVYVFKVPKEEVKYFDSDTISILSNLAKIPKDEINIEQYFRQYSKNNTITYDQISNDISMKKLLHEIRQEKSQFTMNIDYSDIISVKCVLPKMDNPRIKAQSGAFFIFGHDESNPREKLKEFPIKYNYITIEIEESSKKDILRALSTLKISEDTLLPEITNIAKNILKEYEKTNVTMKETKNETAFILGNKEIDTQEDSRNRTKYLLYVNFEQFLPIERMKQKFIFPNNVKVNQDEFMKLLANSLSLNIQEKQRVLNNLSTLSQSQIDSLLDVWYEENTKFQELSVEYPNDIAKLIYKMTEEWYCLIFDINDKNEFTKYLQNHLGHYKCIHKESVLKIYFKDIIHNTEQFKIEDIKMIFTYLIDKENISHEWILDNIIYEKSREAEVIDFIDMFEDRINIDKQYFRKIGLIFCKKEQYQKSLEYFNKIKDEGCILDYVEIALLESKDNIEDVKKYLKKHELDCFRNKEDYAIVVQLLEFIIDLIENNIEDVNKKVEILNNKIDRVNSFELSWDFTEIEKIILKYDLANAVGEVGIRKIIEKILEKQR